MSGVFDELAARTEAARVMAREAGAVARRLFRSTEKLDVRQKGENDWVTEADLAVDRLIRARLAEHFPLDGVFSEESGGEDADRLWIVDPIDGTGNFARGIARFGISIAFRRAGIVELGLVYDIVADEMFLARRGHGATCNGRPIAVNKAARRGAGLIEAGYSNRHPIDEYLERVRAMHAEGYGFCQQGSAAIGLADVACGRLDGYWELHLFSWDVLAGLLLVSEAGGWANAFDASHDPRRGGPALASCGALASALRRLTRID